MKVEKIINSVVDILPQSTAIAFCLLSIIFSIVNNGALIYFFEENLIIMWIEVILFTVVVFVSLKQIYKKLVKIQEFI